MDSVDDDEQGLFSPQWLERWRASLIWGLVFVAIIILGQFSPYKPARRFFDSFNWVTEQAVRLARELFESYGELTVFLGPLLENTLFIGAIIPGTLVMLLAGVAVKDGFLDLYIAIPLGIAGAIIGDTISYGMGRYAWQRFGPESRIGRWAEQMREPLLEHSVWLVLSYHFAGYSRLVGPAASGFLRIPFLRWMVLDYVGASLWVISFIMGGYLLGVAGLSLDDSSERNIQIFEIIIFAFFAIVVVVALRKASQAAAKRRKERRASSAVAPSTDGLGSDAAVATLDAASEEGTEQRVR